MATGLVVSLAVGATPASATTYYDCEGAQHCYATGVERGAWSGMEGTWDDQSMSMPASEISVGGHMTNEMWLATNGLSQFIELGLARQCDKLVTGDETCSGIGGINAYMEFWGDENPQGSIFFHWIKNIDQDGDSHSYEMWDDSNCGNDDFNVYIDYNLINTSTNQVDCNSYQLDAGMELLSPPGINSGESTGGNFDNYIEKYSNSTGEWTDADFTTTDSSSASCTADGDDCNMDPCAVFSAGGCLHGLRISADEWQDSKPAVSSSVNHPAASTAGGPASVRGMTAELSACERVRAVCDRSAYDKLPLTSADRPGAALLTRARILAQSRYQGAIVVLRETTYGQLRSERNPLAGSRTIAGSRIVWVVTQYLPKPIADTKADVMAGARLKKVSAISFIIDAATGQETDSCLGCTAVPR
jgi:hypothetical protein